MIDTKIQSTVLTYLQDTYLFESTAKILDILEHENQIVIVLDQTIFYPQGGGQPSDTGLIFNEKYKFEVQKCVFEASGQVWHLGQFLSGSFEIGEKVELEIDKEKRLLNARNHSAGHFIDLAIEKLNWNIQPIKGFHFPEGPYVEYNGELQIDEQKQQLLENTVNGIIQQNPKISFIFENSEHESGKPMRIMQVEGFKSCPCGGTHIQNSLEISRVLIRKVKNSKGNIRIAYQIEN